MKSLFKISVILLLVNMALYASIGDKKIKLLGNVKDKSLKYITPRYIEENFKTIKVHLFNPWEKRKDTYEGILLNQAILSFSNQDTKTIEIKAIDDYLVTFEKNLWTKEKILLVNKVNGKFISIRQKGPMRIVFFDYDETNKEHKLNLSKWMWMIKSIEFR